MEAFYRTHNYLVEHLVSPVRRRLMDEINWDDRLIGIKGSRGVGKTTFLLQYAKEYFGKNNRECLYINLNHLYFTERTIIDFAEEFIAKGGKVLLIDQVFKYPEWSKELRYCFDNYPSLKIVFTGSSVMRLKEENPDLSGKVVSYNLRGFSFREYLNITCKTNFAPYTLQEILENHEQIAEVICETIKPQIHIQDYIHHGFYPFYLEKRNFSENLLKTMNMILEVDVLSIKQIEQRYLPKIRKLLYLMAIGSPCTPNVSQLSTEIETSRATVMNYLKYLTDARLINMLYPVDEEYPKKPAKVYMNNTNLMFPVRPTKVDEQALRETFFYNQVITDNKLNSVSNKQVHFLVNQAQSFKIVDSMRGRNNPDLIYAVDKIEKGSGNVMPLWIFGFLY
ncbi:MAG TPA: AAA family ATPase [Porphyromonadaceae bacterium]|nr:AAA family ATPase [Porphyromonadaceae bacterium]